MTVLIDAAAGERCMRAAQAVPVPDESTAELAALLDELPEALVKQVFTHASWTERRSDSYERLAFLGDSVLGLAVSAHLYPRLRGGPLRRRADDEDPRAGGLGRRVQGGR